MISWLNLIGWLACVVYATVPIFWFMVHPWAGFWRARRRSPYFALLPAWMGMWLVLSLITAPWRQVELYSARWPWILSLILFAIGAWLYVHSSKNFSARQLGGLPELTSGHTEQRLVTSGIRAHIRHPVYAAHLCEMVGWSVGTGLAVCYGLTAFAIVTGAVMIRMEDRELEGRFGESFAAYNKDVPAIWPKWR